MFNFQPLPKWESLGLAFNSHRVWSCKYFFYRICYPIPFSLYIFRNHLPKSEIFITSRSRIPNPPWYFGKHTISNRPSVVFYIFFSLQGIFFLIMSILFLEPIGSLYKVSMYRDTLERYYLIGITLTPLLKLSQTMALFAICWSPLK
jgi:hypothetical protein